MTMIAKALLCGAAMLWTAVAIAGDQDFKLVNKTGYTIDSIFVSPSDSEKWGSDIMGKDALPDGDTVDISFSKSDECKWDLKATYEDETSAIWTGLDLCTISKVTLRYNEGTEKTRAIVE